MKHLFLTGSVALSLIACSSSQKKEKEEKKSEVPAAVLESFKKQFPTVSKVDWEQEGPDYEAEFKNNERETSVVINSIGIILETETEIEPDELPKTISDYLETNYRDKEVREAARIVMIDGTMHYEAEVNDMDLIFDSNGAFIKVLTE